MLIKIYTTTYTHSCLFYLALNAVAPDLFLTAEEFDQLTMVADNQVK